MALVLYDGLATILLRPVTSDKNLTTELRYNL